MRWTDADDGSLESKLGFAVENTRASPSMLVLANEPQSDSARSSLMDICMRCAHDLLIPSALDVFPADPSEQPWASSRERPQRTSKCDSVAVRAVDRQT